MNFCYHHDFREGLGEGYDGDVGFASALETFAGGNNDPLGVSFGGISLLISPLLYEIKMFLVEFLFLVSRISFWVSITMFLVYHKIYCKMQTELSFTSSRVIIKFQVL